MGKKTTNDTVITLKTEGNVYKFKSVISFEYVGLTITNTVKRVRKSGKE